MLSRWKTPQKLPFSCLSPAATFVDTWSWRRSDAFMCLWKFLLVRGHQERLMCFLAWIQWEHCGAGRQEVESAAHEGLKVSSTLTSWVAGQRGPAECWLSAKKKKEREKTANFWQQHLIKSRGIIELKPVAFNCQDGEGSFRNDGYGKRENTGRGNHFQTTFKQCVRVKVFHFWASSTAPVSQICRPVKCTMKQCRSGFYEDKWVRMLFISWKEGSLVWSFFCSCMSSIWQRREHFIFKKKSQWYPCGFVKLGSIPHKPKWPRACGDLLHSAA